MIRALVLTLALLWGGVAHAQSFLFSALYPATQLRFAAKQLGQIVTNTTVETAFAFDQSILIPAGTLTPGTTIRVQQMGVYQSGLSQSVQPRVRLGPAVTALTARPVLVTTNGAVSGLLNASADTPWGADTRHVVQSDGTLVSDGKLYFSTGATTALLVLISPITGVSGIDPTVDNVLTASVQWSAAQTANQIRATTLTVEILKP